jgi:hypothetical protein
LPELPVLPECIARIAHGMHNFARIPGKPWQGLQRGVQMSHFAINRATENPDLLIVSTNNIQKFLQFTK